MAFGWHLDTTFIFKIETSIQNRRTFIQKNRNLPCVLQNFFQNFKIVEMKIFYLNLKKFKIYFQAYKVYTFLLFIKEFLYFVQDFLFLKAKIGNLSKHAPSKVLLKSY